MQTVHVYLDHTRHHKYNGQVSNEAVSKSKTNGEVATDFHPLHEGSIVL